MIPLKIRISVAFENIETGNDILVSNFPAIDFYDEGKLKLIIDDIYKSIKEMQIADKIFEENNQ